MVFFLLLSLEYMTTDNNDFKFFFSRWHSWCHIRKSDEEKNWQRNLFVVFRPSNDFMDEWTLSVEKLWIKKIKMIWILIVPTHFFLSPHHPHSSYLDIFHFFLLLNPVSSIISIQKKVKKQNLKKIEMHHNNT